MRKPEDAAVRAPFTVNLAADEGAGGGNEEPIGEGPAAAGGNVGLLAAAVGGVEEGDTFGAGE
ncbi:UNVERIFIED_CONTAM: hypothetical protein Sradi_6107000 [Sesamum radiatum]|uniref:Uncharacterized protein n=1 Tax=Sesamum radiatum TaxID=300843 RepID=A0AAW2KKF3_SESRA